MEIIFNVSMIIVNYFYIKEEKIMQTAKEEMTKIIKSQPDDASYEEIMSELAFKRMIDKGLEDSRKDQIIKSSIEIKSFPSHKSNNKNLVIPTQSNRF